VTPLFPVPGNAISNEPDVPLSRYSSGKGPGSLQPEYQTCRQELTSVFRTRRAQNDSTGPKTMRSCVSSRGATLAPQVEPACHVTP
jgi:hypothetical protein